MQRGQNVINVVLRRVHCVLWSRTLEKGIKVTDINVSIVQRNTSLVQAEISMKCTTQLVTGLSARIARKGSCLRVNMRSIGVCTPEKTDLFVRKKVVINIMAVQELVTIMKGSTMRKQCTVITVKLQSPKSAINSFSANSTTSNITKVSMAMDLMPNVVKILHGQHKELLMRKSVLLVEKLKRSRKLVNYLKGNKLFPHII